MRELPKTIRAAAIDRFGGPKVLTIHTLGLGPPERKRRERQDVQLLEVERARAAFSERFELFFELPRSKNSRHEKAGRA